MGAGLDKVGKGVSFFYLPGPGCLRETWKGGSEQDGGTQDREGDCKTMRSHRQRWVEEGRELGPGGGFGVPVDLEEDDNQKREEGLGLASHGEPSAPLEGRRPKCTLWVLGVQGDLWGPVRGEAADPEDGGGTGAAMSGGGGCACLFGL